MNVQYVLSTCMFTEGECRDFDAPYTHAMYDTLGEAERAADELTCKLRSLLDYLVQIDGSDGVSLEVAPCVVREDGTVDDFAIELAIEIVPCRPRVIWRGDECRDNGRPRLMQSA